MNRIAKILITAALLIPLSGIPARAAEVNLVPSNPVVEVDSTFTVDIVISLETGESLAGGIIDLGYEVHELERTLKQQEQHQRELFVESAYLSSPAQIQSRASAELGMVPASLDKVVFLEEIP